MKYLSFKILILCIFLPPVCYIFTIQSVESRLSNRYSNEVEDIYIGDTRPLFDGSVRLKDAINRNIDVYLQGKSAISWGVKLKIAVTTKQGTILHPDIFNNKVPTLLPSDPTQIAAENYDIMNEGLLVNIDLKLEHNKPLSNAILALYVCLSVLISYFYYRMGVNKAMKEDLEKITEISRLREIEKGHTDNIDALVKDRQKISFEINEMKKKLENEKIKTSRIEDETINEMVELEENVIKNIALQEEKQKEIDALKEAIKLLEGGKRKAGKQKRRDFDSSQKRFKTLYKNISINERAIHGFIDLPEDFKIKAEEIIHKLNDGPGQVSIKRKVFGKHDRRAILETIFAYKGRMYFCKTKDKRVEILAIGTKNTQDKDLEYLERLQIKKR